jgi:hypothetical protein
VPADDLLPDDDAPAEVAIAPPATIAPVDAPKYSQSDVTQAMDEVKDSETTMAAADTLPADDLKKARAQYFRRYYRLGEVLTFAADEKKSPQLNGDKAAAASLLKKMGGSDDKLTQVGRAAVKWLAYPKRGEHAGILVGGTVTEIARQGKLYELKVEIPGETEPVSVFSADKPKVSAQDKVILLGSIVDDPANNLPGFTGSQSTVIWNGLSVKL